MSLVEFSDSLDPTMLTDIIPAHEQDAIVAAATLAHLGEHDRTDFWRRAGGYGNCHDGHPNIIKGSE